MYHDPIKLFIRSCRYRQLVSSAPSEAGLTLLESLVAIIVIGITVSAITPAFVLTAASRVQSQKAQQGIQLVRKEVDAARLVMELNDVDNTATEDVVETRENFLPRGVSATAEPQDIDAPTTFLALDDAKCKSTNPATKPDASQACSVDVNGDGEADFAVQAYRVQSFTQPADNELVQFDLGVRVYSFDAAGDPDATGKTAVTVSGLSTEAARLGPTATTNPEKGRFRTAPVAVAYTTITRGERENSLCDFYQAEGKTLEKLIEMGLSCDAPPPEEEAE